MERRSLVLTNISAWGLKSVSNYDVYVEVRGIGGENFQITQYLSGSSKLTWNSRMNFTIDNSEGLRGGLHLVIKIMAVNCLMRKTLGKVRVPITELMEGITEEGRKRVVTRPVLSRMKETGASLTFSYEFRELVTAVTAVPAVSVQGSGGGGYGGVRSFGGGGNGGYVYSGDGGGGWGDGGGDGGWGDGGGGWGDHGGSCGGYY